MKTWGILNTQPVFPEGKHLEFLCWSGEWRTRPKTSRRQKKIPTILPCSGIKDLPGEEYCLKYMIPHSLKTFVYFKVIQVRKIKKKLSWKPQEGRAGSSFRLQAEDTKTRLSAKSLGETALRIEPRVD